MSEAEFMEDGADYYAIYGEEDELEECETVEDGLFRMSVCRHIHNKIIERR